LSGHHRWVVKGAVACTGEQTVLGEGARWYARRDELLGMDILLRAWKRCGSDKPQQSAAA
jgi:hypothetical protein